MRDAIHDAIPLRQCTDRLSLRRRVRAACLLAGIGRCQAPCEGGVTTDDYGRLVDAITRAWLGDVEPLVGPLWAKLAPLAEQQRYEEAGAIRDRIASVVRACARMQRLAGLVAIEELVAARPDDAGGWELSVIRRGRLAAAGRAPRGTAPYPVIDALVATADVVDGLGPVGALGSPGTVEESECILHWLEQPGTRLVASTHPWVMPAHGAGRLRHLVALERRSADPFVDRRRLRTAARPARAAV